MSVELFAYEHLVYLAVINLTKRFSYHILKFIKSLSKLLAKHTVLSRYQHNERMVKILFQVIDTTHLR